jgi:MFS family permease
MRNLWILTIAQAFGSCGLIMLVTFGGIVGARIAPTPALATLPLALSIVGVAVTTVPASMLMRRIGRRPAFIASAWLGSVAALLAAVATAQQHFALFCVAGVLIGVNQAFVIQYRFAATEYVAPEEAGRAVGMVMLGILVAAVLAPELGDRARMLGGWTEFAGSFGVLAVLFAIGAMILLALGTATGTVVVASEAERPLRTIAVQPMFVVAVLAAVSSFAVMSFIMTATPISMHVHDGIGVEQTKRVITAHLIAMYAPSLASGWLTRTLGLERMMLLGVALMGACVAIAAGVGQHFIHYLAALVLLGLGWNLLFVAGTTMLTRVHTAGERFKVQGLNDFATFGTQAMVSLLAGTAIEAFGWARLNLLSLPLLVAMLAALWWLRAGRSRQATPVAGGHA